MEFRLSKIETVASENGMTTKVLITSVFSNEERIAVNMGGFKTALFLMNNKTFDYTFEKVYNATIDKTSNRLPQIFK